MPENIMNKMKNGLAAIEDNNNQINEPLNQSANMFKSKQNENILDDALNGLNGQNIQGFGGHGLGTDSNCYEAVFEKDKSEQIEENLDRIETDQLQGAADIGDGIGGGLEALGQIGGATNYPNMSDEQNKNNADKNQKFQNMNFNNQGSGL